MGTDLTPSQRRVVEYPYKPNSTLKVTAGPGSGKTFTLLRKVHHLITTGQVKPEEILVLSLTNKAVDNIVDKLLTVFEQAQPEGTQSLEELKDIVGRITVSTIHSLANRIVVENEGSINIIGENGWRGLLKLIPVGFWKRKNMKEPTPRQLEKLLKQYKLNDKPRCADGGGRNDIDNGNDAIAEIAKLMENCKVLTNDDLILKAAKYLQLQREDTDSNNTTGCDSNQSDDVEPSEACPPNVTCLEMIKNVYKVVLIDEFQDLYPSLLPIIENTVVGKQLIMFGDTDQSIYYFLGSNREVIEALDTIHPAERTTTLYLYDNFRCTPEISEAASSILPLSSAQRETPPELVLKSASGVYPLVSQLDESLDQMEFLVSEIAKLSCFGVRLSDIAVLTRTNQHLKTIAEYLELYGVPFVKLSSQPDWITDVHIQFLLDLLKVITFASQESQEIESNRSRRSDFSLLSTLGSLKGLGSKTIYSLYHKSIDLDTSLWKYITEVPMLRWEVNHNAKRVIRNYSMLLYPYIQHGSLHRCSDPITIVETISSIAEQLDYAPVRSMNEQEKNKFRDYLLEMLRALKLSAENRPNNTTLVEWFLDTYFDQNVVYHSTGLSSETSSPGAVRISTIHSSKGLEFPVTMIMEPTKNDIPIDRNSLYVAMTRARNLLYLINVNYPGISPGMFPKSDPFKDGSFWKYYSRDLNRRLKPGRFPVLANQQNYSRIRTKYNFREYATMTQRKIRTFCRLP